MDKKVIEGILKAIKDELEFDDDCGYSQWIMAVSIKEIDNNTYLTRVVIKTNYSPYVDGTDITVNITDGKAEVDLSFIGEAPIFHGGEIADSMRWIENINNFCYIQSDNPFDKEVDNNDQ